MKLDISEIVVRHTERQLKGKHVLVMRYMTIGDTLTMHQLNHQNNGSGLLLWFAEQIGAYEVDGEDVGLEQWFTLPDPVLTDTWALFVEELGVGEADASNSA